MAQSSVKPAQARRSYQQELVPSKKRDEVKEKKSAKGKKDAEAPPTPPSSPPPAAQPAPPPSTGTPSASLAERYVAQYEKNSGTTLTSDERSAKVQEIETFYGESSRQGRLERIVFA